MRAGGRQAGKVGRQQSAQHILLSLSLFCIWFLYDHGTLPDQLLILGFSLCFCFVFLLDFFFCCPCLRLRMVSCVHVVGVCVERRLLWCLTHRVSCQVLKIVSDGAPV